MKIIIVTKTYYLLTFVSAKMASNACKLQSLIILNENILHLTFARQSIERGERRAYPCFGTH